MGVMYESDRVTRRESRKRYAINMRSVAACWIGGYESKGTHLCSAWCPITNLLAIGAKRRRDHGAPVVILWEPSIPDEHFELSLDSPGEETSAIVCLSHIGKE